MSRSRGPGHQLLFHKRDYWIPILSTVSGWQYTDDCLARSLISFVFTTNHPQTDLPMVTAKLEKARIRSQNKNLRIIKDKYNPGLRADTTVITNTAS